MKRLCLLLILSALFCGCAKQPVLETITDDLQYAVAEPLDVILQLPEYVCVPVFGDSDGNKMYICDDYTVETYIMPAGDVRKTVSEITGFDMQGINIMETISGEIKRYDCTWTSAGETQLQTCRATILDDGNYHYVLTVIGDQQAASEHSEEWRQMFKSYMLSGTD